MTDDDSRKGQPEVGEVLDESPHGGKLITQPRGGALWRGAPRNIVPGPGRPPDRIRAIMRQSLDEALPSVQGLLEDPDLSARDRVRVLEFLAKYGLGPVSKDQDQAGGIPAKLLILPALQAPEGNE